MILSFAMALKYSLDFDKESDLLESAIKLVLKDRFKNRRILWKKTKRKFLHLKWVMQ